MLQAFLQMLYGLDHYNGACSDWQTTILGTPVREIYQGNCMQAYVWSLFDHTLQFIAPWMPEGWS